MKKNIIYLPAILSICLAFVLLLSIGCTKDEILIQDFIELSENAYTFDASGDEKLTVTVDANAKWDVNIDAEWVSIDQQNEKSITLTVLPNIEIDLRSTELVFTSGMANAKLAVQQIGANPTLANYSIMDEFNGGVVCSPNGKYLGCIMYTSDETTTYSTVIRINTDSWEKETLEKETTNSILASTISDNGIFICGDISGTSFIYGVNGERSTAPLSADYQNPVIYGISSDGSIMVGYVRKMGTYDYVPGKWVNNVFEELPVPAMDIFDEEPISEDISFYARGCSADGSVIYGSESTTDLAIYWKDGKVNWVGKDVAQKKHVSVKGYDWATGWYEYETEVIEQPEIRTTNYSASPDGKYLVGLHTMYDTTVTPSVSTPYPFIYDTTTETTTIITNFPNNDPDGGEALAVSNDGIVSYSTYETHDLGVIVLNFISDGFIYDINSGTSMSTSDYLKKKYDLSVKLDNTYIFRHCPTNNFIYGETRRQTPMGYSFPPWIIQW